jgi:hypothetical protein
MAGIAADGVEVVLERCVKGRLRAAYPVAEHDVEARFDGPIPEPAAVTSVLERAVATVLESDPQCRRVVFAAPEGDVATLAAAERAGFRFVVDVDLPDGPVGLAVAEPEWVTAVDMDLDRVPQT